jgi:TRAP-type uncharacterized transport system substrate-binding protein
MKSRRARLFFVGMAGAILCYLNPAPAFADNTPPLERCRKGPQQDGVYRLATGPKGGSYVKLGQVLMNMAPADMKIVPCLTEGSLENIDLLTHGDAEFAIAQQDVLHIGWSKEPPPKYTEGEKAKVKWPEHFEDIKLVRWLYSERLQIIAGPHAYVTSLADVTKERFWLGPEGGGTYATAVEVLRAAGMSLEEIKQKAVTTGDFDTANDALYNNTVPVIFRTTPVPLNYNADLATPCKVRHAEGKPNGAFTLPAQDDDRPNLTCLFKLEPEVQLVGLDNTILKRLKQNPSYVVTPIYRNTYPNQNDGILTIGLGAALITRDTVSDKAVTDLYALFDSRHNVSHIQDAMNVQLDLLSRKFDRTLEEEEAMLIDAVHPAVRDQLTLSFVERYKHLAELGAFAVLLLCLALWHRGFRNFVGNNAKYVVTTTMILVACGIFGLVLWGVEGRFTSAFENPLVAAWSLIVYFAQGLKTETLVTSQGQFLALLALAVIATLVHTLNSDALDQLTNRFTEALRRFFHDEERETERPAPCVSSAGPVNGETFGGTKDFPAAPAPKPAH